jgi:hypothetical protein
LISYNIHTDLSSRAEPATVPGPAEEAIQQAQQIVKVLRWARARATELEAGPAGLLTVFLAPEFYFCSAKGLADGTGHFSMQDVLEARQAIRQEITGNAELDDWLLVPGSAVYRNEEVLARVEPTQPGVLFNEVWAMARGTERTEQVVWTCQKEQFSNIDGLVPDRRALAPGGPLAGVARLAHHPIVTVGGRTIGIEVCLDHALAALKADVHKSPDSPWLDLQLITACGMDIGEGGVAARTGGYVFLCNGNDYNPPMAKVVRVDGWPEPLTDAAVPTIDQLKVTIENLPAELQIQGSDTVGFSSVLPLP